jgi:hypothetical protein
MTIGHGWWSMETLSLMSHDSVGPMPKQNCNDIRRGQDGASEDGQRSSSDSCILAKLRYSPLTE